MKPQKILKDFYFIERGFLNGNHFVITGDNPALVDTGYLADLVETEKLINQTGLKVEEVKLIVNTHTHCDHIGANAYIQKKSQCRVALHKIGAHFLKTGNRFATWWDYYQQEAETFTVQKTLVQGDLILLGDYEFEVIETKGHAADGICLYQKQKKILISSDALWEKDLAVMTPRIEGSACVFQALKSLDRLSRLKVETVYPGHGKAFKDMEKAIAKAGERFESYLEDPIRLAGDQIKRIFIYTLLMLKETSLGEYRRFIFKAPWFKETVDMYFKKEYKKIFENTLAELLERDLVTKRNGKIRTTVKP